LKRDLGKSFLAPMYLTDYHAKYFAHDLTRRAARGMDRLSMSLLGRWRSSGGDTGKSLHESY